LTCPYVPATMDKEKRKEAREVGTWTLGPLIIQEQMLIIVAAVAVGYVAMRLRLRYSNLTEKPSDRFVEALFLWLLVWKLSVLVFNPQSVWDSPWALLYFSGGNRGAWLAALIAITYVWYKDHKSPNIPIFIDSWLVSILVGYTSYRILELIAVEVNVSTNGALALLGLIMVIVGAARRPQLEGRRLPTLFLSFVIAHALISTIAANTWEKTEISAQAGRETGTSIGAQAPDFELTTLQGDRVKLSDFRGKKVVLNFWATWCPPCRVEMPHMQRFYSEYKDRNVVIVSVDAMHTEVSKVVVQAFADDWGLTFPVVLDTVGEVGKIYQVTAYPATYILDEQGIIRKKHPGAMDQEMLEKAVR
jgi:peroxiredoxin